MTDSLTRKIENLFEETIENKNPKTFLNREQKMFEVERQFRFMENINFDPNLLLDSKTRWLDFCKQIVPYFDGGYLTVKEKSTPLLKAHFLFGTFEEPKKQHIFLKGPQSSVLKILKTDASSFLKKLKLNQVLDSTKYQIFYIRLDEDFSLYLLSSTPEPWNQLKMEVFLKKAIHFSCDCIQS